MLSVKNLNVIVGKKKIIKSFSFDFKKGKIYVIMGPNGSGKSSLAFTLMGHPLYQISKSSRISINKKRIEGLEADKRAKEGLFLSFQSPLSLSGVSVRELIQLALSSEKKDPLAIRKQLYKYVHELKIPEELIGRSLNDGASGGEKKKLEALQAAMLDKQVQIFDELDTGVDVDALKSIATFLKKHQGDKTYIIITHYNRILKYLAPDRVLILKEGVLVKEGDRKLAKLIEKEGYEKVNGKKK